MRIDKESGIWRVPLPASPPPPFSVCPGSCDRHRWRGRQHIHYYCGPEDFSFPRWDVPLLIFSLCPPPLLCVAITGFLSLCVSAVICSLSRSLALSSFPPHLFKDLDWSALTHAHRHLHNVTARCVHLSFFLPSRGSCEVGLTHISGDKQDLFDRKARRISPEQIDQVRFFFSLHFFFSLGPPDCGWGGRLLLVCLCSWASGIDEGILLSWKLSSGLVWLLPLFALHDSVADPRYLPTSHSIGTGLSPSYSIAPFRPANPSFFLHRELSRPPQILFWFFYSITPQGL